MKLIYINSGRNSVFDSQVLTLLNYYVTTGIFQEVTLLFGYRSENDIKWLESKDLTGIKVVYFKSYPNYPFYNYWNAKSLLNAVKKVYNGQKDVFFHIRGEMTSYHFKNLMKKVDVDKYQVLTDVRGVSFEEVKEFMDINPILKKLKLWNLKKANLALSKDEKISVVSPSLSQYLVNKWNINPDRIYVNSCLVSEDFRFSINDRIRIRKKLKIKNDDILIVFSSGGIANWQENNMITKIADLGFKVLNLSKIKITHPNIINRFVPYHEVPGYLSAADAGFIWRRESIVNKVASPVKFSEYIACGLPVIHNGTIDLINNVLREKKINILIKSVENLNMYQLKEKCSKLSRENLSKSGQTLFSVKKIFMQIINLIN